MIHPQVNAGLDERIGDMRARLDAVQEQIVTTRKKLSHLHLVINSFKVLLQPAPPLTSTAAPRPTD